MKPHTKSKKKPQAAKERPADHLLKVFDEDRILNSENPGQSDTDIEVEIEFIAEEEGSLPVLDLSDVPTGPFPLGGRPKMRGRLRHPTHPVARKAQSES